MFPFLQARSDLVDVGVSPDVVLLDDLGEETAKRPHVTLTRLSLKDLDMPSEGTSSVIFGRAIRNSMSPNSRRHLEVIACIQNEAGRAEVAKDSLQLSFRLLLQPDMGLISNVQHETNVAVRSCDIPSKVLFPRRFLSGL